MDTADVSDGVLTLFFGSKVFHPIFFGAAFNEPFFEDQDGGLAVHVGDINEPGIPACGKRCSE